jgi:hypothetical protein
MKIRRDDTFQGSDRPFIAVTTDHFAFNAMFVRIAELSPDKRVTAYADPENLKLGFEFHTEEKPDSFIKSVTKLPVKDRRFEPKKEGHLWVIQLCPAFEERKARESADIPSDATGIYRYVRDDGEIVYIGRGNIKNRLASPEREDWEFAVIEYSILENPDQQLKWEDYWLTRYQEEHGGKLPIYNKILGTSTVKK